MTAHTAPLTSARTAVQIFQRAQKKWEERRLPPYIEFDVDIAHRDASGKVTTGREHVVLRTFDHWCATRELDSDIGVPKTSAGIHCVGPADSPLGFNISAEYPTSGEIDPFGDSSTVIASVKALHYDVTLAGEEIIDARKTYHLRLEPIADPQYYPLRALWVSESTSDVLKLGYVEHVKGWDVGIDYSFRQFERTATWWVSEIDAQWSPSPNSKETPFQSTPAADERGVSGFGAGIGIAAALARPAKEACPWGMG